VLRRHPVRRPPGAAPAGAAGHGAPGTDPRLPLRPAASATATSAFAVPAADLSRLELHITDTNGPADTTCDADFGGSGA